MKKILILIYKYAYLLEKYAKNKGIYTECDLYNIRFYCDTKHKKRGKHD